MIRIPLAPLRLTDYTRLTSPLSPHKKKSGSSTGSGSSRTSSSTSSWVATPSDASSSSASASSTSASTSGVRLSTMMPSSLLPSPFATTTTPPVSRSSTEDGGPLKTLYEAPRPSPSSSASATARAMAHEDEEDDDDDDDSSSSSPDDLVQQNTRAATTPPRRLMDLFLSSAAKDREPTSGSSHSPRSPQPRSRTRSEPVNVTPSRNGRSASGTTPAPSTKDEEMAAPTWSFYEDPVEPTPVASTTSNDASEPALGADGDEAEYYDENLKLSPTSLARRLRRRSRVPVETPLLMPSPTSISFSPAPQAQVVPPSTPPPTSLEWTEMDTTILTTTTTTTIPVSPPSIFPSWDPIEDSTKRENFFGDMGNHSFDSRISSHGFEEMGRKRSGLGEDMFEEAHEGKRMRLSSE